MKDIKNLILKYITYTLVLICVSYLFKSFYFDNVWWILLVSVIVFILNNTIKPILIKLTVPITGLTYGLFYFIINFFILKIADWVLLSHFDMNGIFTSILIVILISILNMLINMFIVIPIKERVKK